MKKSLINPEEIKESSKQYLDDSNMIKNFIDMYYDKSTDDKDRISTTTIFADYCCKIGKISSKTLVKEMKNLGFGCCKSNGKRYFINIKEKNDGFLEDDI